MGGGRPARRDLGVNDVVAEPAWDHLHDALSRWFHGLLSLHECDTRAAPTGSDGTAVRVERTHPELAMGSTLPRPPLAKLDAIIDAMWTVVVLDVSLSMPIRDYWKTALQDVVALVEELQDPGSPHQLKAVIAFSEVARVVNPAQLADIKWEFVYGSNIASALHLALAELDGKVGRVVIFSDMEATAHVGEDGRAYFSYPPDTVTTEKTFQAVSDCLSSGTQLELRRYCDDTGASAAFVDAFVSEVIRLGGTVTDVIAPST